MHAFTATRPCSACESSGDEGAGIIKFETNPRIAMPRLAGGRHHNMLPAYPPVDIYLDMFRYLCNFIIIISR